MVIKKKCKHLPTLPQIAVQSSLRPVAVLHNVAASFFIMTSSIDQLARSQTMHHSIRCLQNVLREVCTASDERCEGLGTRIKLA